MYFTVFVAGLLAVSLWSAWLVTHPARIESGLAPKNFNLTFEEVTLETKDGVPIDGWFIPSAVPQKPALAILHGYPAEKGDMLFIANALHPNFNIILIDFRYFGKSGGDYTTFGTKERLDLGSALDFLESRGFKKTGVLGFSLGGATAIMQAIRDPRIAAIVSYASFADLTVLGKETYRGLPIIREILVPLMKFWAKIFWGLDPNISPMTSAEKLSIPILLVHTKHDEQISFRHAELLKDALKENRRAEFYFPDKGLHGELPADFEERVEQFFLKYL